jgi:hypothetical protein
MLQCWMDSYQDPGTRSMPGCGVADALAIGRDAVWDVHISHDDAVRLAEEGLLFLADPVAVAGYHRMTGEITDGCRRAALECAEVARRDGVPHRATAAALERYFAAYTVLQAHFQATSPTFTAAAEAELDRAVRACTPDGAVLLQAYTAPGGLKGVQEADEWWSTLLAGRRQEWTDAERDDVLRRHVDRFRPTGALGDGDVEEQFRECLDRWERDSCLGRAEVESRAAETARTVRRHLHRRRGLARRLGLDRRGVTIADNLDALGVQRMSLRDETSETTQLAYEAFARVFALVDGELDPVDGVRQLSREEVLAIARDGRTPLEEARARLHRGLYRLHGAERVCLSGAAAEEFHHV